VPILDSIKAKLTDHLQTLMKNMSLGTTGGEASRRNNGVGNVALTKTPVVQRVDDRTISVNAIFGTDQVSSQSIKEVVIHGSTPLDDPAFRSSFIPISKNATNEVRIDVVMEVR
jgi:hypothetical protein